MAVKSAEKFTFFWRKESVFSQWYPARFKVSGITYNCAEQYMMHQKAVLFGDQKTADEIMTTKDPRKQKGLGRKVSNFNQTLWNSKCRDIVKEGSKAKFRQNPDLLKQILDTEGTTLVEASPDDKIWGIGLTEDSPLAQSSETWEGKNWLGYALTEAREEILSELNK